ncbi:MAG: glycosyltransferase [Bryobacteraceae bacterium]
MSQLGTPFSSGDLTTPQARGNLYSTDSNRCSDKAKRFRVVGGGDELSDLPTNDDLLRVSRLRRESNLAFTGERVVPGEVETQLWNEHVARYRFACLFAGGRRVLDVGCGAGYGTSLLASAAQYSVGFDVADDAVQHASKVFDNSDFLCASAGSFPLPDGSFDLVTAFEVIEHLEDWNALINESARVLSPDGVFLVSTPNTSYYAEARGPSGPNPFHVHEFEFSEFEEVLKRAFPFVEMLGQNSQETITFSGEWRAERMAGFVPSSHDVADAHFYVAVCSFRARQIPFFADVSSTHNLLRDRERHIRGLQGELAEAQRQYEALVQVRTEHKQAELLESELDALRQRVRTLEFEQLQIRSSAWMRLGRVLGVGPWSDYRAHVKLFARRRIDAVQSAIRKFSAALSAVFLALLTASEVFTLAIALLLLDVCFALFGRKRLPQDKARSHQNASIVIPNWNGLELLRANLPSVVRAASKAPGTELLVVDNASTDGSVEFIKAEYPDVNVLQLEENEGFAGACNRGSRVIKNDIVVFLNNDMRVEDNFLPTLLANFSDPQLFAASSQIFFADKAKLREETGLTEVWWDKGSLHVSHRNDPLIQTAYPCAYPGGGSSAFDRAKFLELGGFDSLFHPFYYEDTDLGFRAWKRGWKVLYEPRSIVHHEHRGTIGKKFSPQYIDTIVRSNSLLYCWKNIHSWSLLSGHLGRCFISSFSSHRPPMPAPSSDAVRRGFRKLGELLQSRWRAHQGRKVTDQEAFLRPLGGYFRDRFALPEESSPHRLNVLLVSPYPIEPPTHGGAVFMKETIRALHPRANVHVVSFVDHEGQLDAQKALVPECQSASFLVRPHISLADQWTLTPNAIREFGVRDFAWAVHRTVLLNKIDVVQLEYTTMGQYAGQYRNIPCILFEHDISAQSLWRRIRAGDRDPDTLLEYVRMRLYEPKLLKRVARVQVCSKANAKYLRTLSRALEDRIDSDVRATIDVGGYQCSMNGREPDSLLFIGSFRHSPNLNAIHWFIDEVFPLILKERPQTLLYLVGSDAPEGWNWHPSVRLLGTVPDIKVPLQSYSVFVCPILSGSGIRVKLLEAFASGIPVVSTSVGAEGLASHSVPVCEVADSPSDFAKSTLRLLSDDDHGRALAKEARRLVESDRDSRTAVTKLEALYRSEVGRMRGALSNSHISPAT